MDQGNSNVVPVSHEDIEVISIREENRTDTQIILTSKQHQIEDRFSKLENSLTRIMDNISEIPTKLEERLVSNLEEKLTHIKEGKLENMEGKLAVVVQQVDDIIKSVNRDNRDKIKRTNTFRSISRKFEDYQV